MKLKIPCLKVKVLLFFLLFPIHSSLFTVSHAAHPLITDDTGTQGKGKFQLEINSEFTYDKEREFNEDVGDYVTVKNTGGEIATILSYGISDNMDMVLGLPYQWTKTKEESHVTSDEDGISDMSFEVKWRFYEKEGLSFALKPRLTLPTGEEEKGLGAGRATYSVFLITTKEIEPWAFHLNLGYIRNENKVDERKDIWHVSLASTVEVIKDIKLVADIGAERNLDKASNTHPAFILGGLIYSISENFDIDFGIKGGLNKPETDYSLLAGITWRF